MSREKLLGTIDKYDHIIENLSENELEKIVKMQNLSLKELEQIVRMNNFSENKLKEIAKIRSIKKYEDMSKEDFLIALLKSNQSHTELRKSKDNNMEIEETNNIFNELRYNFSKKKKKKIKRKFYFTEAVNKYLKKLEKKNSITNQEKKDKKSYNKKLEKVEDYLKILKEDLNKFKKKTSIHY